MAMNKYLEKIAESLMLRKQRVSQELLQQAEDDPDLTGFVLKHGRTRTGIEVDNKLVGFLTPRLGSADIWRTGAIYISPEHRGKGYAKSAISKFFENKKGLSMIEPHNLASQKAFESAGFKIHHVFKDHGDGTEYNVLYKEAAKTPLAIIVKGNPKFTTDPKVSHLASSFYSDIRTKLETRGYKVEMDDGKDFTIPNINASLWVGHSRGIGRLRFAPDTVKTYALQTKNELDGLHPDHYLLSNNDLSFIESL